MNCGLLGRKLGHSVSPQLHALFGDYVYGLYEREETQLPAFLQNCGLRGLNVTVPYKQTVLPYCDTLTDCASAVGSVNTLLFENGKSLGDNTDVYGFQTLLAKYGIAVRHKKVLVLGSGGASKAVQYVLREQGADVTVISRRGENNYVNLCKYRDTDIIVNATPVGMYPDNGNSLIDLTKFPACATVIDLIYNPLKTALLLQAEALGKQAVNGLYMLTAQAKRASELFQKKSLPDELTETAFRALSVQMQSTVLIGMPGCGKTAVGRLLAEKLHRPFFDSDEVLTERYGDIPMIFREQGEDAFRAMETEILSELGRRTGIVLATGGGAVTRSENYDLLRQNGRIICLDRPELAIEGRPLSQKYSPDALRARREPLYRAWAERIIPNSGTAEAAVDAILEAIK